MILWAVLKKVKLIVITPPDISFYTNILKHMFLTGSRLKATIEEHRGYLGDYKELWYEVNGEAIDLTQRFYKENIGDGNAVISYYNRLLSTRKTGAYFKHKISYHVFALLNKLHLMRLLCPDNPEILTSRNAINKFVIEYMEKKYGVKYRIKWILPAWRPFLLFIYYGSILLECIKRGIVINKGRKIYKISKEACAGFVRKTHRDDMIIDNDKFKKSDILFLKFNDKDKRRAEIFNEAKKRGFNGVAMYALKININRNILSVLFFYFLVPLKVYFQVFFSGKAYLFYYVFLFHKTCFPAELLMNLYDFKCHISENPSGDIAMTIILNKYGAKNVVVRFSDLSSYRSQMNAFIAHNVFYVWSQLHYDHYRATRAVDESVNTGCIFKREFNKAFQKRDEIIDRIPNLKNRKHVVTFFDGSFQGTFLSTESFFLQYRKMICGFCRKNKDVNVMLKPKGEESIIAGRVKDNPFQYKKIWEELMKQDNFTYLDERSWSVEEAIAISDVCVTMAMHTPSTVALICGKNGLYFDTTGNPESSLMKKYKDIIVFDDEELLFRQINNILDGRFRCRDIIGEDEIREYDAFSDDNAVERLRGYLYKVTTQR